MKKYIIPETTVVEVNVQAPLAQSPGADDVIGGTPGIGSRRHNNVWDEDDEDEWLDE